MPGCAAPIGITVRPMFAEDVDSVAQIESYGHAPCLVEGAHVLRSHLELYPAGCWVAELIPEGDGRRDAEHAPRTDLMVHGYLIACPWRTADAPMPLHATTNGSMPADADTIYVHDLCVLRRSTRLGIGSALLKKATEAARHLGLHTSTLVAVGGSEHWWASKGYHRVPQSSVARSSVERLREYSGSGEAGSAVLMQLVLLEESGDTQAARECLDAPCRVFKYR